MKPRLKELYDSKVQLDLSKKLSLKNKLMSPKFEKIVINMVKKHLKTTKEKKGGIISKENFIHLSNLQIIENKKDKTKEKKEINKK